MYKLWREEHGMSGEWRLLGHFCLVSLYRIEELEFDETLTYPILSVLRPTTL